MTCDADAMRGSDENAFGGAGAGGHTWAPTYFAVLLWNKLMGNTVYDFGEEIREGIKINRKSVMQIILSV